MDIDRKASQLKESRTPFCIATVVKVEGSAPRHMGAKMIVTQEASFGTIGGGGLEHQAIKDAREVLHRRQADCRRYSLTEGGIQPCGGQVEIFFEPAMPPKPMVVFGAGHIAEKLCPLLVELGFETTLVDEREERLALPAFENIDRRINKPPSEVLPTLNYGDELHIISITHKHIHDEEVVEHCLDKSYRYLGLISSRKKWELFKKRFHEKGYTDEQLMRVSTPIGLDIGAESPFEIAVAIVAQLIWLHAKPEDFEKGAGRFAK